VVTSVCVAYSKGKKIFPAIFNCDVSTIVALKAPACTAPSYSLRTKPPKCNSGVRISSSANTEVVAVSVVAVSVKQFI
jgi:hypothetical protein